ncbi:C4-dicarboxylate transport sensor kinase [Betaproteobacteria bacterium]|nr:C4-dicarboxylate transport sensor kinase [Betaproteobacteria bacterium]
MRMEPLFFPHSGRTWFGFGLRLLAALVACVLAGWGMYKVFFAWQLDLLSGKSQHNIGFYRMSLDTLLSRNESLPRILALEDRLKELLRAPADPARLEATNNYLLEVKNRGGLNAVFLMDRDGLTLAASNFGRPGTFVGHNYGFRPYFQAAMKGQFGIFYGVGATTGEPGYFIAAPIRGEENEAIGVVIVKISLEDFEGSLVRNGDPVLLADSNGVVFLASAPELKYRLLASLEAGALAEIDVSRQYGAQPLRLLDMDLRMRDGGPHYLRVKLPGKPDEDYQAHSVLVGRPGWTIILLTQTRQEQQSAMLAGVAAGLAVAFVLSLVIFFRLNARRYTERRQAEAALRQAHASLEARIAERTEDLTATNVSLEEKVAALKTTENILRETRDTAVQAGKLTVLGQMAAGITHEVNQPLTALHTFTDNAVNLLELGKLDEVRENLGLIQQMARRMGHIVGEIKNFTRRPSSERYTVDVASVVFQALMLVEAQRKRAEARIDVQSIPDDLRVWADAQRLEQVLVNLLLNAVDAVGECDSAQRQITVLAQRGGGQVRVLVRDSGPGIPEAVLTHLFEPFFTTKPAGRGIGLGLAISRMIMTELGGRLDVRNHEKGGAEFTVTLEEA